MREPLEALRTLFGFEGFRGPQSAVIADVMAGSDVALVMPTGAGKSLCYQIPAICRPGCGIIVSPLIALMADQVQALGLAGVRAAALNSQSADAPATVAAFRAGRLDLLYVAPERAATESFRALVGEAQVSLLAIDEAHCVSQWGHDFRPDYRKLRALADLLPGVPRIALTATADAMTRADICEQLAIAPDRLLVAGFDRPNIRYGAEVKQSPAEQIAAFVAARGEVAGIVYCQTRADSERMAATLAEAGTSAYVYHAGLPAAARAASQKAFQRADHAAMCATVAFGMGIDKPDIRYVVHHGLPKSIEAYYQETGRAGRDGAPAIARLFWGLADIVRAKRFIAQSDAPPERKQHELRQVQKMLHLAETTGCRRVPLLLHFGEPDPQPCGNCDNCLGEGTAAVPNRRGERTRRRAERQPAAAQGPLPDVGEAARKLLSAIYRTGQAFGIGHVTHVLRGNRTERVETLGHDQLSVWAIGTDVAQAQWYLLARIFEQEGIIVREEEGGALKLTEAARPILRGERRFHLADLEWAPGGDINQRRSWSPKESEPGALFIALKEWRRARAKADDVPAYVILHDTSLAAIAEARPATLDELSTMPGIGAAKLERYGEGLLAVVSG